MLYRGCEMQYGEEQIRCVEKSKYAAQRKAHATRHVRMRAPCKRVVPSAGFEPVAFCSGGRRSIP